MTYDIDFKAREELSGFTRRLIQIFSNAMKSIAGVHLALKSPPLNVAKLRSYV